MSGGEAHGPWYVRVMLGIAGLIAAIFLLGFFGLALRGIFDSKGAAIIVGAMIVAGAYVMLRFASGDFGAMFSLALSLAGQVLLAVGIFGVFDTRHDAAAAWTAMALVELGLAFAMPNYIHRLAAALAVGVMLQLALTPVGGRALTAGVLAAALVLAWFAAYRLQQAREVFIPIGYGAALALVVAESARSWTRWIFWSERAPAGWITPQAGQGIVLLVFVAAIVAYLQLVGWRTSERRSVVALATAVLVAAASFKAPGIASGLLMVLAGFAAGRRVMIGLGIAALLFYLSSYYYLLDATLLYKAGVLAATGVELLAARWVVLNLVLAEEARA